MSFSYQRTKGRTYILLFFKNKTVISSILKKQNLTGETATYRISSLYNVNIVINPIKTSTNLLSMIFIIATFNK